MRQLINNNNIISALIAEFNFKPTLVTSITPEESELASKIEGKVII